MDQTQRDEPLLVGMWRASPSLMIVGTLMIVATLGSAAGARVSMLGSRRGTIWPSTSHIGSLPSGAGVVTDWPPSATARVSHST